jgi:pyruvate formate lyase activating enzyme
MKLSAIQPFTVLDYPGKVACMVFTPGCNFRCGYCHNPEFVLPEQIKKLEPDFLEEETVIAFLGRRKGLLDGVVVTGGEPTLHSGLPAFLRRIKGMGFLVKLDTNGSRPEVLSALIDEGLLDYVAMDVKTSLDAYPALVGPCVRPVCIESSARLIRERVPDYEFRTTLLRGVHGPRELEGIRSLVTGARRYALQKFRPSITLDPALTQGAPPDDGEMRFIAELFRPHVGELILR